MKHYANPITGRHKPSPLKADANLIMGEGAMRAAGAVKPIAYSSTEQAAEPVAADVAAEPVDEPAKSTPPARGKSTVFTEKEAKVAEEASLNFMQKDPGVQD